MVLACLLVVAAATEAALEPVSIPRWADALFTLGFTLPLAWRRRAPLAVLVIAVATVLAYGEVELRGPHQTLIFALALASFTVGYELERPRAWLGPLVLAVALLVAALALGQAAGDIGVVAVLYGGPWLAGQLLRARERRVAELAVLAAATERERERRAQQAVDAERARIARELHDIVSHSISVVAIQVQAVRRRLASEQEREASDLAAVETTARQALAEMRRLLGVLRADGERLPLAPQPGLDQLGTLVERTRATGLRVDLDVSGALQPVGPGVDLVAYRVIQEALTNVLKHARATSAAVAVRYGERLLELTVEDDGASAGVNGGGHGLVGMQERVALYGGTLEARPRPEGGFRVHAALPLRERSRS